MGESMAGLKRSHMCGTITEAMTGNEVTLMGWVQRRRNLGQLIFITLRDKSGIVQIAVDGSTAEKALFEKAESIRSEYVLAVKGTVALRTAENINASMPTGKVEIIAENIRVLSEAETPPFQVDDNVIVNDELRLKYRYLDLRRPMLQKNIQLRHDTAQAVRKFLNSEGFLEIETPMLTRSTPEGARDYLVPSRVHPGEFYALPQSPQLLKQMLMVSGMDKYYQIVRCFRDEDLRADRQPEFTQIDMELSFVDAEDVMSLNERLIKCVFKEVLGEDVKTPFIRMPYAEAMERYGSDKPDTRFGMELKDISAIVAESDFSVFKSAVEGGGSVRGINAKGCGHFPRKQIDSLVEFVKTYKAKGLAWISVGENGEVKSQIAKFFSPEKLSEIITAMDGTAGDLLLFCADGNNKVVFDSLGALRIELAERLGLRNPDMHNFLWVTEFPLLEWDDEENRFTAVHHPFTSPMDEDIPLLDSDPAKARAKAYDVVLNGVELGGGSIRIHRDNVQKKMFGLLGFTAEEAERRFGYLLTAFKYGVPPHGGLAFGFDRMIMLMANADSIKEVIAFPKLKDASCPLTDAPNIVEDKQLKELSIKIDVQNE